MVSELDVLGIVGKLSVPSVTLCKKIQKKLKNYYLGDAQNPIDHNMVARNFKLITNSKKFNQECTHD